MTTTDRSPVDTAVTALIALAARAASRGWTPATSGNFSVRVDPTRAVVTASGRDKGELTPDDARLFDVTAPLPADVSAEAPVHAAIYRAFDDVGALVHIHTIAATVLSRRHVVARHMVLEGLEMEKALRGVTSHDARVELRVYPNTQDMEALARVVARDAPLLAPTHAFLLAGHGIYAWGATPAEAFRHVEALDFLLTVRLHEEGFAR